MRSPTVRQATVHDAAACAAIYAYHVLHTVASFETKPPGAAEMADRISDALATHAWLVLVDEGAVVGYAYAGDHRARAGYQWTCEVSVYLQEGRRRSGGGRALYDVLLPALAVRGFRTALAGMTLPNEASEGLHRAFGFEPVGVYRNVGFKDGRWHDTQWLQKDLASLGGIDVAHPAVPA
ncbi:GNAT family N-acetyltransferase [Arthrobacter sp. NPDC092385]|uniref:GNAT family N-acetyltransferase n=1 Tax=Arthrobacter sp. NPDC092385 TaxID=3363943 RepID=UPI0038069DB4